MIDSHPEHLPEGPEHLPEGLIRPVIRPVVGSAVKPVVRSAVKPVVRSAGEKIPEMYPGTPFGAMHRMLKNHQDICLRGSWGFAMTFYAWLKKKITSLHPIRGYESSRRQQEALKAILAGFWVPVEEHRVALEKAPGNPWLRSFYPNNKSFLINFADLLGMNGARQWFEKGIRYPLLNHPIHPFYGVYFPTRHEHLHLLDNWLKEHNPFQRAVDIGCGCGVLSFILYKHGIRTIHATDTNPNAVYSFRQDLQRLNHHMHETVSVEEANLLGSFRPSPNDLVVFNPPWIPEKPKKILDTAFYFEDQFFDDFFSQMTETCPPGTTIALIFSNFSLAAGIAAEHPIEQALQDHQEHFSLLSRIQQPVTQKASRKKSWIQQVRNKETVELFVIRKV